MNNEIISLEETSENNWQAKYLGNYGIYNIKIKIEKGKVETFSCSCPSDYTPCKHIGIIKNAINNRIAKVKKNFKEDRISIEELLQNVSHKKLVNFIVSHAKYNPEFTNKILLEFLQQSSGKQENNYNLALRNSLNDIDLDYDDIYEYQEDSIEIDVLDEWINKAWEYINLERFDEAIAICKACIEEFAEWMEEMDDEIIEYLDPAYTDRPFELLTKIALNPEINTNGLFQYCLSEMDKPKYSGFGMDDKFNDLLANLAMTQNEFNQFIELQDKLLERINDKSSKETQIIIERKIAFYTKHNQPEIAWQLVAENIQFKSFRKQVVQQYITDGKFTEAKSLITEILDNFQDSNNYYRNEWDELALSIAQKENDIPGIRKIAYSFIENRFESKHYNIYKSSYDSSDWVNEVNNLIAHYEKKGNGFNEYVAGVLAEEKDASRLIMYIEKYLSISRMDSYHTHFAASYPKETLDLFRRVINYYADKNTGRPHYEYMVSLFKKIVLIEGGKEMLSILINQLMNQYKNRRAMIEIFSNVKF